MSSTTMQGTITPPAPAADTTPLLAVDRCDGPNCNAQAYVRVQLTSGGELLFCGHDYRANEEALATIASHVHDERHLLLPKPFDPATDNC
jgi:hypothetical protein